MSEVLPYGHEYDPADWPHGLRCAKCERLIQEGDRYASELSSFVDEIPILVVVCLGCALNPADTTEAG